MKKLINGPVHLELFVKVVPNWRKKESRIIEFGYEEDFQMSGFDFDVITLFPKAFELINNLGVITRALEKNLINVNLHDLREYGEGNYRQVDDKPYGGGSGMVLKPEPIYKAHDSIKKLPNSKTLLMTPQGKLLKQQDLLRLSLIHI